MWLLLSSAQALTHSSQCSLATLVFRGLTKPIVVDIRETLWQLGMKGIADLWSTNLGESAPYCTSASCLDSLLYARYFRVSVLASLFQCTGIFSHST